MLSFRFNGYMKGGPRLDGIRKYLKINKYIDTLINEKALRETQTLHAGCSKMEPKVFTPPQTPFPEARHRQNLKFRHTPPAVHRQCWPGH